MPNATLIRCLKASGATCGNHDTPEQCEAHLRLRLRRLHAWCAEDPDEEPLSETAVEACRAWVPALCRLMGERYRRPFVTFFDGSIHCNWHGRERDVLVWFVEAGIHAFQVDHAQLPDGGVTSFSPTRPEDLLPYFEWLAAPTSPCGGSEHD